VTSNGGLKLKRLSRVLCAVAVDDRDRAVFAQALWLARRHDAQLLLLHAASPQGPFNRGATERVDFLRQLRALADAAGIDIRVTVQTGPVDEMILLHARARQVDLIVLGAAHDKETRRGLAGWIAERVLRDAPCPTLVVTRTSAPQESTAGALLCAVDFSPASQAAVAAAIEMSEHGGRPATLLHVVEGGGTGQQPVRRWIGGAEYDRALGADALKKLRSMIPPPAHGAVMARVAVGEPVNTILHAARRMNAGLLVIGAARRTRIGSTLFGKTGQLIRDAQCPILAVPAREAARDETEHLANLAA
jgi:nucleotide-binding universal stress UspA family protein